MVRKILFFIVLGLSPLGARLIFVGPNPYFSYRTFPQDTLLFKNKILLFFSLQRRGWMGNLDDPEASPSPTYISTEESVSEDLYGQIYTAGFKGTWKNPSLLVLPYSIRLGEFVFFPLFSGNWDLFNLRAGGTAIGEEDGKKFTIPFSSELSQTNSSLSLGFMAAGKVGERPVGLLVEYKRFAEGKPQGFLKYTMEEEERELGIFNWGWSTVHGCNHIFGVSANIDSFWQDFYASTSFSQLDLVLGADLGENKIGFRLRRISGAQAYFEYDPEANAFSREKWGNSLGKITLRNYGVWKLGELSPKARLFLVTFLEASFVRNHDRWMGEELLGGYRENDYELEALPFLHFDLPRNGFLRIGTSLSLTRGSFKQVDIWGGKEVIAGGWANYGWEESWERPSYGNFWRIVVFSEADLEVGLSESLRGIFHLWTHHTFYYKKKFYGNTKSEGDLLRFEEKASRRSYLKEFWLSGTLGFLKEGPVSLGVFLDFPIQYDNYMTTEVKGTKGYFKGKADPQPKVRKPVVLWAVFGIGI